MSSNEYTEKIVTGDLGKAIKPVAMTPVAVRIQTNDGISPAAMTPVVRGEDRGLKTVPMTPVQPLRPAQPAPQPAQPGDSGKK
jgi:hypothetical protein